MPNRQRTWLKSAGFMTSYQACGQNMSTRHDGLHMMYTNHCKHWHLNVIFLLSSRRKHCRTPPNQSGSRFRVHLVCDKNEIYLKQRTKTRLLRSSACLHSAREKKTSSDWLVSESWRREKDFILIKKTKFHTISETLDVREITTAKTLSIIFVQKRLEKDLIFN